RDQPGREVRVPDGGLAAAGVGSRHAAPPVAFGVDRPGGGPGVDEEPVPGEVHDVVVVDDHVGARTGGEGRCPRSVAEPDAVAGARVDVVELDHDVGVTVEEPDRGAAGKGGVRYAVVVNGRVVRVEEQDAPAVHVEHVRSHLEEEDAARGIRVADVNAGG